MIAALHGNALGGGFEVALAAHYRIALAGTRIGLPEVTLGILPGAGGTQRAPRLCGAATALQLMIGGAPISAEEAMGEGLIDGVVDADVGGAAIALARMLAEEGKGPRPTRDRREGFANPQRYEAAIRKARGETADPNLPAPSRIVDCIEAALLLPFEAGLAFERAAFDECVTSDTAAALRHAFFAERAVAKIPEAEAEAMALPVSSVGVVGGGLMGAGIAAALMAGGYDVHMVERDQDALVKGLERVSDLHDRAIARGKMTEAARDAQWQRFKGHDRLEALADCDLVIEAVFEDFDVKAGLLRQLDGIAKPGALLATNTSYLDVDALAAVTSRPEAVLGLHFFSPAHVMKLLEVVVGEKTAPSAVLSGFVLAKRLGKTAVRAGVCDGFIGNRILAAYRTAADFMLEDGASPAQIDAAMRAFGMPLGPYQVLDLAGLDISWARRKRLASGRDPQARYVAIGDRLCEAGRFGQKTGQGYYNYGADRKGSEAPEVLALIAAEREAKGIIPRAFEADEIQRRCLAAMVNEGARLYAEGIALRPSDIDVVMMLGYGYPRWRGGPMKTADLRGLLAIRNDLESFARDEPAFWAPAPILDELIKNGRRFPTSRAPFNPGTARRPP
ncbi:MAG: 3-hydroxyacyl-CoA dehydrogenase NAD-binding domain-containing protein [Paracoccaceae bacterium]